MDIRQSKIIMIISCILVFFLLIFFLSDAHSSNENMCIESITTVSGTFAPKGVICSGSLIFEDDFEVFDFKKWQHVKTLGGGGNSQFQWYTNNRSNSYVENGILHIRPTFLADERGENYLYSATLDINGGSPADECTNSKWDGCIRTGTEEIILNPIKSACIRTVDSFAFKYGELEIRAKLPVGDWLWPAAWMMPRWNEYSSWPSSGEFDILEARGNRNLTKKEAQIGIQQVGSALHFGPHPKLNRYKYTHFLKNHDEGWNADFHVYKIKWNQDKIEFLIDDVTLGKVSPPDGGFWELGALESTGLENPWKRQSKIAPFDQEFFLIINLAIGGTSYFSDYAENHPESKPWKNSEKRAAVTNFWKGRNQWLPTWNMKTDDTHFQIDHVRIWAL
ncbi:unnamed protein product [Phaedon cochleariae]|uniref:GH16 domain-containing protein n=1 Tax=Phaedon cochleariae TaxID=80249 RepID=A0A9P0DJ72_PHACE|nr:unnamed protein product [Phaedon cochleariae]